ncbi:hypothetical protein I4U23_027121 [Adineta vaga]|nr:hypothetical protein I4U23_027121 [Adineta vaga]
MSNSSDSDGWETAYDSSNTGPSEQELQRQRDEKELQDILQQQREAELERERARQMEEFLKQNTPPPSQSSESSESQW